MKLQPDLSNAPLVRAYTPEWLQVDAQRFSQSVWVYSFGGLAPVPWAAQSLAQVSDAHWQAMAQSGAELVILGTGARMQFAPPTAQAPFALHRVGLECMDTAAACRTYNVLASEGRKVLAALLMPA